MHFEDSTTWNIYMYNTWKKHEKYYTQKWGKNFERGEACFTIIIKNLTEDFSKKKEKCELLAYVLKTFTLQRQMGITIPYFRLKRLKGC